MSRFLEALKYPNFLTTYNPFFLKDMSKALERTVKAINDREKIVIYGACNADAICGVSLLFLLFKYLNADVEYYIQDSEADKLDTHVIRNHINFLGAKLIVTVGCGAESVSQIQLCKSMGIDVIIINNSVRYCKIDAISINPKQKECLYKFKELSFSGLSYKLAQALSMYYEMKFAKKYTDLVLIGTVASGLPVIDENEIFVKEGLKHILKTHNHGIKALLKVHNINEITMENIQKLVMDIKPTTNAIGKMDNARIAVELFTTSDGYRAEQIAKYLNKEVNNSNRDMIIY
ncbi:DHH family phosphoesterase [Clostridium thermarum]|uniref:DHH family phosphoesterase n=1 Tax=Clostridium thermarum TaxID=1716543 RepID=UPI001121544B|nr:DHH family phosphoesterase [Clostridium thermarum]